MIRSSLGMKFYFLFMIFAIQNSYVNAQEGKRVLKIGDVVPETTIHHVLNAATDSIRTSDLRGKLVLVDFFTTSCGTCIGALPRMDSIQRRFGDDIQIIVVTNELDKKITKFLNTNPNVKGISLPFVTADSLLAGFFPHALFPHEIWIDQEGKVFAITAGEYVTADNIQSKLQGATIDLPLKMDRLGFDHNKPLFENDQDDSEGVLYRSVFGRYLNGVRNRMGYEFDAKKARIYCTNIPLIGLYQMAVPGIHNRIVLNVDDSDRFIQNAALSHSKWSSRNCFCYEASGPPTTPKEKLGQFMLQDLNRYLDIAGHLSKQPVECWALKFIDHEGKSIQTQGGPRKMGLLDKRASLKVLHNFPLSRLIGILNYQPPSGKIRPIVVDESHYKGNVDLDLKIDDIYDIPSLRVALRPYGLDLIPVKREIEMLVLSDDR